MKVKVFIEGGTDTYEHIDAVYPLDNLEWLSFAEDKRALLVNSRLVTHILCEPDEPEQPNTVERLVGA